MGRRPLRSPESVARRREAHRAWQASPAGRAYMAAWRRAHRAGETARGRRWKRAHPDRVRAADARRSTGPVAPLPPIYPELNHGVVVAFWEDELRMDLAQERALAELEGRDPDEAVRAYQRREKRWSQASRPLLCA